MFKRPRISFLLFIIIILCSSIFLLECTKVEIKRNSYDTRIEAFNNMEKYKEKIREIKYNIGIPIDESIDYNLTGLIGIDFSGITTTLGSLESKRTASNSEMAVFIVHLLEEKGLKSGDRVGAVFSGSFPGLDLALIAACDAMDIDLIYISSIGASTYGANNEQLTLPEILDILYREKLIKRPSKAYSIGGTKDIGEELDADLINSILDRMNGIDSLFIYEDDYNKNISKRIEILESEGTLDAFVNVGGHTSGLGRGENSLYYKPGWQDTHFEITENSGLVEVFVENDIPTLHLLNIKQLTGSYNVPFDPIYYPREETISTNLLFELKYNSIIIFITLSIISTLGIIEYRRRNK